MSEGSPIPNRPESRRVQGYKPSLEREGGFHGVEDG